MSKHYDVIIVGAGPAGIFSALELAKKSSFSILILEKGQQLEERARLAKERMLKKRPSTIVCGWGGAGAFSDGKLTLSSEIGGWLSEYLSLDEFNSLMQYVDDTYQEFGAPKTEHGLDKAKIDEVKNQAKEANLTLIPSRIRHLGTDRCYEVLKEMRDYLQSKVEIRTDTEVAQILDKDKITGIKTEQGEVIKGKYIIVAPGRAGSNWLLGEVRRLGLGVSNNAVDIGVRVETEAKVFKRLTDLLYEPKLIYTSRSFKDKVRTFCMNPCGEVTLEVSTDLITVNGHSYAGKTTDKTNFALLVSTNFTEPFNEPIAYGKYIARLANLLGDGIIVQRLGDLKAGRRSTPSRIAQNSFQPTLASATPGDLSFVLPFRYISNIMEMLEALDKLAPGANNLDTLLYGVEVKFYSARVKLSRELETKLTNLFTIGDGAGLTRGLIQSSISGVSVARTIMQRDNNRK